jgi:hypothetical protein
MFRLIIRGGASLAAAIFVSALFASVALGAEPTSDVDVDVDLTLGGLLDADVEIDLDAEIDLDLFDDDPAVVDADVDAVVLLGNAADRDPIATADADATATVDLNGVSDKDIAADAVFDLDAAIDLNAFDVDDGDTVAHVLAYVPIDLLIGGKDGTIVHALLDGTAAADAGLGEGTLADVMADVCLEAIIGSGDTTGCGSSPDAAVPGDEPGDGGGGPGPAGDESPEGDALPSEDTRGPALPDTALMVPAVGLPIVLGLLALLGASSWSARRRVSRR